MKISRRFTAALVLATLLLATSSAFAQRTGGQTGVQYNADGSINTAPAPIITEIVIPGTPVNPEDGTTGRLIDLAQYIGIVYNFLLGIIGMVAAVMIVIGGFQYLTSAGDPGKIGAAKTRIVNALIGMVLALGAFTILNTINPAMLTLKVPGGITGVRTEVTFMPFCDNLAKQYGIAEEQITNVGNVNNLGKGMTCGEAGFIKSKIRNSDGTMTDSRIWCVWRGTRAYAEALRARGEQYVNDYGCLEDTTIGGERVIGSMLIHALAVCVPYSGINQAELNEQYDKSKTVSKRLATCMSCNNVTDGAANRLGWPTGDQACQYWQNTANNGDPRDNDFKISKKKIMMDSRLVGEDDRRRRMYYCGYSANYHKCIYVPILCHRVGECDDYDDMVLNYCEDYDSDANLTCHANQTLGSSWGTQAGNAAHLIPVCQADPCEKGPSAGCNVGGLAGTRNTFIGRYSGGYARMGLRVITGGLAGSISCDAQ